MAAAIRAIDLISLDMGIPFSRRPFRIVVDRW
jgi:hypothetical protein